MQIRPPSLARRHLRRSWPAALVLLISLSSSGCAPSPVGVYADTSGATQYEFRPNGEVYISVLGVTVTGAYEASRERILISGPQGAVVLMRRGDRLQGPMGLELVLQSEQRATRGELDR